MKISRLTIQILQKGGIGVLPTDTLYGLVGQALKKETIKRIYRVRKRNPKKPFIILISNLKDLSLFGITTSSKEKNILKALWKKPITILLDCPHKKFHYLHRGQKTLAFRLPADRWLRGLIKKTGPLVAPSANLEGLTPAYSIKKARTYFDDQIDFYADVGLIRKKPSTIIRMQPSGISILRKGSVSIKFIKKVLL